MLKTQIFFDLTVIQKYFSKYDNSEIITDNYDFFFIFVNCHFQMTYYYKILKKEIKY